jgi:hypothetical protein
MKKLLSLTIVTAVVAAPGLRAQDAGVVIAAASKAMGADELRSRRVFRDCRVDLRVGQAPGAESVAAVYDQERLLIQADAFSPRPRGKAAAVESVHGQPVGEPPAPEPGRGATGARARRDGSVFRAGCECEPAGQAIAALGVVVGWCTSRGIISRVGA